MDRQRLDLVLLSLIARLDSSICASSLTIKATLRSALSSHTTSRHRFSSLATSCRRSHEQSSRRCWVQFRLNNCKQSASSMLRPTRSRHWWTSTILERMHASGRPLCRIWSTIWTSRFPSRNPNLNLLCRRSGHSFGIFASVSSMSVWSLCASLRFTSRLHCWTNLM